MWHWVSQVAQSVLCLTTKWKTGRSRFDPRQRRKIFSSSLYVQNSSGSAQPPIQWVPRILSPGAKCGLGVTLTTYPYLLTRSWMSRSYTPLSPSASMACSGTALLMWHWKRFLFELFGFSREYHFIVAIHTHISSGGRTIGQSEVAVQRHRLTPLTLTTKIR
jgi:hypothetical protein